MTSTINASNRTWLMVSQVTASLSNVVVVIAAAATLSSAQVGVVSVILAVYFFALTVARGVIGDPALLRASLGARASDVAGGSGFVGSLVSVVAAAPLVYLAGEETAAAVLTLLAIPFLAVQDSLRYAAFAQERPRAAAVSDLTWLLLTIAGLVGTTFAGHASVRSFIVSWTFGGLLATALLMRLMHASIDIRAGWHSLRASRRLRAATTVDSVATNGVQQLSLLQVAWFGGLTAAGVTRFVQSVHGPVTLIFAAMYVDGIWITRKSGSDLHATAKSRSSRMFVVLTIATVVTTTCYLLIPESLGVKLAGETFEESRGPMMVFTIAQVLAAWGTAYVSGLRFIGRVGRAARIRLVWAVLVLVGAPLGAYLHGASGYFVAMAVANLVGALLWRRSFHHSVLVSSAGGSLERGRVNE